LEALADLASPYLLAVFRAERDQVLRRAFVPEREEAAVRDGDAGESFLEWVGLLLVRRPPVKV